MVVKRFIAVFYPSAEFMVTTRITKVPVADQVHHFQTNGKVLVKPGWMAVYGKEAAEEGDDTTLVAVQPGEAVRNEDVLVSALKTKPPARYTEATLLSAMEGAGKLIDDEELKAAMTEKGLGTPATRAAIIEGLITEKYLYREGREMIPTAKAFQLMTLLRGLGVEELSKPELTGEWEYKLAQMEHGQLSRDAFMREIAAMTEHIVKKIKEAPANTRWLVGTELNLVNRLAEEVKPEGKTVQFMAPTVCMCSTMQRIDPQHLAWTLENLADGKIVNPIRVPEHEAVLAKLALERMLAVS